MTEQELKLEILCYQNTINSKCDINNLTLKELAEFMTFYLEMRDKEQELKDQVKPDLHFLEEFYTTEKLVSIICEKAPILEVFEDIIDQKSLDNYQA